jgi:hypothetical protein
MLSDLAGLPLLITRHVRIVSTSARAEATRRWRQYATPKVGREGGCCWKWQIFVALVVCSGRRFDQD